MAGRLVPLGHKPSAEYTASAVRAAGAVVPGSGGPRMRAARSEAVVQGRGLALQGPSALEAPRRFTERVDPANLPVRRLALKPPPPVYGYNPNTFTRGRGKAAQAARRGGLTENPTRLDAVAPMPQTRRGY